MKIVKLGDNKQEIIDEAISVLKSGGLVVVPSDTVYGLSVDATNSDAVQKLIDFKSRVPGKAISVFVGSLHRAKEYVSISDTQSRMLKQMLPGAYTVVLPSLHHVDKKIEAENGSLGIRVPDYNFINSLVETYDKPITATSANQASRSPHHSIESLLNATPEGKKELIDLVIDAGKLSRNKPSTVIDLMGDETSILRQGDAHIKTEKSETFTSNSEEETGIIARKLLHDSKEILQEKPVVFMLSGNLGAGKTVFSKAIGKSLGATNIVSPTFVIYYEYKASIDYADMFYHFDLYKIREADEFRSLGIEELLKPRTVHSIEWSEKSAEVLPMIHDKAEIILVNIQHVDQSTRSITISRQKK